MGYLGKLWDAQLLGESLDPIDPQQFCLTQDHFIDPLIKVLTPRPSFLPPKQLILGKGAGKKSQEKYRVTQKKTSHSVL